MAATPVASVDGVLPPPETIQASRAKLLRTVPPDGIGLSRTVEHLQNDVVPALSRSSRSANYYGFVTGGATDAAVYADKLAVEYDQNVQVHLPNDTLATDVEDAALGMICDLVDFAEDPWSHRTFTTGATASNVLGLACGREFVVREAARRGGIGVASVGQDGLVVAMRESGLDEIQILTTVPHSSLGKAASIVGLGRSCIKELGLYQAKHHFDFAALEAALANARTASIIVVSCAEVNTGFFATSGEDMRKVRSLADKHGAWIHIDAAFGFQARILPQNDPAYRAITDGVRDIDLADSITADAHKLFNVPYDCGIFLSRHLLLAQDVFRNAGAAYLNVASANDGERVIPSPLNIGIENSRRFRAFPVYATLVAYGRLGHQNILRNQISLARGIARFVALTPGFELLPRIPPSFDKTREQGLSRIYIVVLFRAVDDEINRQLVQRINNTRKIYVSGTQWDGMPAARFAVSNWQVDVDRDLALIKEVLLDVLH